MLNISTKDVNQIIDFVIDNNFNDVYAGVRTAYKTKNDVAGLIPGKQTDYFLKIAVKSQYASGRDIRSWLLVPYNPNAGNYTVQAINEGMATDETGQRFPFTWTIVMQKVNGIKPLVPEHTTENSVSQIPADIWPQITTPYNPTPTPIQTVTSPNKHESNELVAFLNEHRSMVVLLLLVVVILVAVD